MVSIVPENMESPSEATMPVVASTLQQKLWVPGYDLDEDPIFSKEYPVPTTEELITAWSQYSPGSEMSAAPGVYGIVRELRLGERPKVIASIDICEVLRHTRDALVLESNDKNGEYSLQSVLSTTSHEAAPLTNAYETKHVKPGLIGQLVVATMNDGHVKPVDRIGEIADILRGWRDAGVFIVPNTSTLRGCERATIEFFWEHLEGCFDGILFPRNHDGSGSISKGMAVQSLLEKTGFGNVNSVLHIDDTPHHLASFVSDVTAAKTTVIAPHYVTATGEDYQYEDAVQVIKHPSNPSLNPYETFQIADKYLSNLLGESNER